MPYQNQDTGFLFDALNQEQKAQKSSPSNQESIIQTKADMFNGKDYDKTLQQFKTMLSSNTYQHYSGMSGK